MGKAAQEDILAVMKRAYVVIFGRRCVFVREPSPSTKASVKRFAYWPPDEAHDLLTTDGVCKLGRLRLGDKSAPPNDAENRMWQLKFIQLILKDEVPTIQCHVKNYLDDKGCILDKVYIDEKPDIAAELPPPCPRQHVADAFAISQPATPIGAMRPGSAMDHLHRERAPKRQRTTTSSTQDIDASNVEEGTEGESVLEQELEILMEEAADNEALLDDLD